jgi:hypothetical protein
MARTSATNEPHEEQRRPGEGAREADLTAATMPSTGRDRLIEKIRAYVRKYPQQALALKRECVRAIDEERPPSEERYLRVTEAARRAGLCHSNLLRLLNEGVLGERNREGQARYSEAEIDRYVASERKPGPKPRKKMKCPLEKPSRR